MNTRLYLIFLIVLSVLLPQKISAQVGECIDVPKTRVMLVGDSWAHFCWIYQSMGEALRQNGFADIKEDGNFTALVGMQAEVWASEGWIDLVKGRVKQMQDVDVFVIFIGGNDVMWKWRLEKPIEDLLPYMNSMLGYTDVIIDEILKIRPEAQIVIASYDYPNFAETMQMGESNPYYSQWEKFSFSPPSVLNPGLIYFEDYRANYPRYKNTPNIHHINNIGSAQYYGGYPTPSLFEPFGTFAPKTVPLPFGDPRYPTHPDYMGLTGLDAYHFNGLGYQYVAHNIIRTFLGDYLRKDFNYSFTSTGEKDGWVANNGAVSQGNGGKIGKMSAQNFASIFSFNTSNFPEDVTIEKGALYLARKSGLGQLRNNTNASDRITVEMKIGHFGNSDKVEADDFSAAADFVVPGCIVGNANGNDYKFRVDLSQEALAAISKADQVQFRVKVEFAPNAGPYQYFDYHGGNTEDKYWAPTLDLKMSEVPEAVGVKNKVVEALTVYPNPTKDILNIDIPVEFRKTGVQATLTNALGSVVKAWNIGQTNSVREVINLKELPVGAYNLSITDGQTIKGGNIIVQR